MAEIKSKTLSIHKKKGQQTPRRSVHERKLEALKREGAVVKFNLIRPESGNPCSFIAKVLDYDKFTVVIEVEMSDADECWEHVLFKHSIEAFVKLPDSAVKKHVAFLKKSRAQALNQMDRVSDKEAGETV